MKLRSFLFFYEYLIFQSFKLNLWRLGIQIVKNLLENKNTEECHLLGLTGTGCLDTEVTVQIDVKRICLENDVLCIFDEV